METLPKYLQWPHTHNIGIQMNREKANWDICEDF